MPNGFMFPGGSTVKIILRAKGTAGVNVQATFSGKTYTGVVGASGYVDIPLKKLGAYSVKSTSGSYTYTQTVNVYQYGITECWAIINKPFGSCTPAEIQAMARTGLANKIWHIGDSINVTMKDKEVITLQIYDFNHDVGTNGSTVLPLTLGMKDCFKTLRNVNNSDTNVGGWMNCNFRTGTLPSLKENFPDEWKKIMTKCRKLTSAGNQSAVITQTDDDLFLFSEVEVFGSATCSFVGEGKVYPIFTDNESRIKRVNGAAAQWWERSPATTRATNFCTVHTVGTAADYPSASTPTGIALGFCVG